MGTIFVWGHNQLVGGARPRYDPCGAGSESDYDRKIVGTKVQNALKNLRLIVHNKYTAVFAQKCIHYQIKGNNCNYCVTFITQYIKH